MAEEADKEVGSAIRRARTAKGLTLQQLADKLGVGIDTVARAEKGYRSVKVGDLLDIAAALEVTPSSLLPGAEPKAEPEDDPRIADLMALALSSGADPRIVLKIVSHKDPESGFVSHSVRHQTPAREGWPSMEPRPGD